MSRREKKSRVGAFFGGGFLGFLLGIGTVVGLLCLVYFKVTPNLVNKMFKTGIDLGETNNDKTLSDLVGSVSHLIKNKDNYKLSDLKSDFGIEINNQLLGIDISDLKDVPLSSLGTSIENKFANISAHELRNIDGMDLEQNMGKILDRSNTYFYNNADSKLYKTYADSQYSNVVNFNYSVNQNKTKIIIKGREFSLIDGKTEIVLWYLPIASALGDFMQNMGNNLTLADLEKDFGVKFPSFMDNINKETSSINDLEAAINDLYVADFLGYAIDSSDPDNVVVKKDGVVVDGILAELSKHKINELEKAVNSLTLADLFSEEERDGVLLLIDNLESVTLTGETDEENGVLSITDALEKVISEKSIGALSDAGLISYDEFDDVREKWIDVDLSLESSEYVQIQDLTVGELLDLSLNILEKGGLMLDEKPIN